MAATINTVHNYALVSEAHPGCTPKYPPESTLSGICHMGYEHIVPWHINVQRFGGERVSIFFLIDIIKNISNWKYYYITD